MQTDQNGQTGYVNSTGHYHNGNWYLNSECPCALVQDNPK